MPETLGQLEGTVQFFLKKTFRKRGIAITPSGKVFLPAITMRVMQGDGTLREELNGARVFPNEGDQVVITNATPDRKGFIAAEWYIKSKLSI